MTASMRYGRGWPPSLTAHVSRGVVRAVREGVITDGVLGGVMVAGRLSALIGNDLILFPLTKVGFAARAVSYRLRHCTVVPLGEGGGVEVYGNRDDGPFVLFVHGGSWGQGAPWQYSLLARRLLDAGAGRVGVVRYRLFPDADVDDMVADVGAALAWARGEAAAVGAAAPHAAAPQIVLAAHSAGAHLCSLYIARAALTSSPHQHLPDRFVALSGVFDIAPHFAHERTRHFHWLSPMHLTMLGRRVADPQGGVVDAAAPDCGAGLSLHSSALAELAAEASRGAEGWGEGEWSAVELQAWAAASPTRVLRAAATAAAARPPWLPWPHTVVIHAADDRTVPVRSAREFVTALRDATAGAEGEEAEDGSRPRPALLAYEELRVGGHGDAMVALAGPEPFEAMPAMAARFVEAILGPDNKTGADQSKDDER